MPSMLYFAIFSALGHSARLPEYARRILAGELRPALRQLHALQDKADNALAERDAMPLQALGDAMMTVGDYEEAEDVFRKAQKAMRHDKEMVRLVSCRNTAWLALSQSRFSAALNCFARNAEDADASVAERIEAMAGMAITRFRLGQQDAAGEVLRQACALAAARADARWCLVLDGLFADLAAHRCIRASRQLSDHAFWHSAPGMLEPGRSHEPRQQLRTLADRLGTMPLLQARMTYLGHLLSLSEGARSAYEAADAHANAARTQQFVDYHRAIKLEIALTALAPGLVDLAERTLDAAYERELAGAGGRWNIDYLYCMAKIRHQQGRVTEALGLYHRYALDAIQCLRTETHVIKPLKGEARGSAPAPTDDVGARLPAKYRRAYRYMIANIDRSDLSIHEIAMHVGVTARALQLAFKEHLGLSPSEVIRRHRMEGIREDLLDNANPAGGILQAASRWGVKSRSTLVSGYRKHFLETPSQTLQRA